MFGSSYSKDHSNTTPLCRWYMVLDLAGPDGTEPADYGPNIWQR